MGLQVGDTIWGYGWYFNAGWTTGTVYFSPRFTAYFHRHLEGATTIGDVISRACVLISIVLGVATAAASAGLAIAIAAAIAALCFT